jgi:hypothetical protein
MPVTTRVKIWHGLRSALTYNENADHRICPAGKVLDFQRTRTSKGTTYTVYRGHLLDCPRCEGLHAYLSTLADKKAGAKIIEDNGALRFRISMKEKMAEPAAKEIYAQRAIEPEPVWGQWKKNLNMKKLIVHHVINLAPANA